MVSSFMKRFHLQLNSRDSSALSTPINKTIKASQIHEKPFSTAGMSVISSPKKFSLSSQYRQTPNPEYFVRDSPWYDSPMEHSSCRARSLNYSVENKIQLRNKARSPNCTTQNTPPKHWVKLGGLGPNIGHEAWNQAKHKIDRIKEYSSVVREYRTKHKPLSKFVM